MNPSKKKQLILSTTASDSSKSLLAHPVTPFSAQRHSPLQPSGLIQLLKRYQSKCVQEENYEEAALASATYKQLRQQKQTEQQLQLRQAYIETTQQLQEMRSRELQLLDKEFGKLLICQEEFEASLNTRVHEACSLQEEEFMRMSLSQLKQDKSKSTHLQLQAIRSELKKNLSVKRYDQAVQLRKKIKQLEESMNGCRLGVQQKQLAEIKNKHYQMAQAMSVQREQFANDLKVWRKGMENGKDELKERIERRFRVMLEQIRENYAKRLSRLQSQK